MKTTWIGYSFFAVLLLAASCIASAQIPAQNAAADLGGTSWQLVKFQGGDEKTLIPKNKEKYTIAFGTDGGVSARIDCNRGRGTWKSEGPNQLQFTPLALTRAMCPAARLNDRMVEDWQYVRSYTMKDSHLFLSLMADGGIYEFEPVASSGSEASASLENTHWKLTGLGDRLIDVASQQREPYLTLNPETRRVAGSGGCNRLMGSYELNGDDLSFGKMAGTMMACAKGMETEKEFLEALAQVKRWKISGQQLVLSNAVGNLVARFEAIHMK